jgi:phosphohistidine swiveling domain-containing protein/protein-tyrosine-phosphatase
MKEIKKVLFVCSEDCSLNPLFVAILQKAIKDDPILSVAGIRIDSAEISYPGMDLSQNDLSAHEIKSVLAELGFQNVGYQPKNIKMHPDVIEWADLILVPRLSDEDLLCLFYPDTWSKSIEIESFCGRYEVGKELLSYSNLPKNKEEYLSISKRFNELLPDLMNRIKDSYAYALIVKGKGMNQKTASGNATVIGRASVVRCGYDLINFVKGNILVVDRLGAVFKSSLNKDIAEAVIKKFIENPDFYKNKKLEVQDQLKALEAVLTGKTVKLNESKVFPDDDNAIKVIVENASGIICSRGYHVYDVMNSPYHVPYLSCCVGATQLIKDNQLILMDVRRGEVYDASLLRVG